MVRQALWLGVYERVKRRILTLELPPGAKLSESGLASEFGLSPTPVRDALGRLCQEGLVVTRSERGYWVAPLDVRDLHQLAAFRFMLERGAAELLHAELPDLEPLRQLASELRMPGLTLDQVVDSNIEFHAGLAELTGNERLCSALRRVLEDSARYFRLGAAAYPSAQMADDHTALLDALESGNMEAAVEMYHHEAFGTRDRVIEILVRSPPRMASLIGTSVLR